MLVWNVYYENFNTKNIGIHNVFDHPGVFDDCRKAIRKYKDDKDKFIDAVKTTLMYHYWSKCEWEIVLQSWPPRENFNDKKIDAWEQIAINWDIFVQYVWENRKEFTKKK